MLNTTAPGAPSALDALHGATHSVGRKTRPVLLLAGATGSLGAEVLRLLLGSGSFSRTHVLAQEPMRSGMANLEMAHRTGLELQRWPLVKADVAVVMFEPPRLFHRREQALWVPRPEQLPALAHWLQACGVHTLAVVVPHTQGSLPSALKQGLASLSEQAVSALSFERVIWVRSSQKPKAKGMQRNWLKGLANVLLSAFGYMVPQSQRPLRASQVAQAVSAALRHAPRGIHVLSHEALWQASRTGLEKALASELQGRSPIE